MRYRLMPLVAAGALVFAACDSDDDGGGGASGVQAEAAQQAIDVAEREGFAIDEDCVNDLAGELSDDDAQAIVDAGPDGDAELSSEGAAVRDRLLECVDQDVIVDLFIQGIEESGATVDEDCLRDALEGTDLTQIDPEDPPSEVIEAVIACGDF